MDSVDHGLRIMNVDDKGVVVCGDPGDHSGLFDLPLLFFAGQPGLLGVY
ncbi:unnamed protein product [Prunus brigantina]